VSLSRGFGARLAFATSLLIALVCVTESWILSRRDLESVRAYLEARGRATSESLAREAAPLLSAGEFQLLERLAERARSRDGLAYAWFFDASGLIVTAVGTRPAAAPPLPPRGDSERVAVDRSGWEFRAPVPGATGPAGTVAIANPLDTLDAIRRRTVTATGVVAVLFMLGAIAAAAGLARAVARPLQALATAADAIARGDLAARVAVTSVDEIGALARSFNAMAESLARNRHALEEKVVELEEASRLKSEFLATISHELRTPLNVILGYAEMLEGSSLDEEQAKMLDAIRRYSKVQLDLITNILDFSRLSSGRVSFQVERFRVAPLLDEVATAYAGARVSVTVAVDRRVDELVTDRIKLREVVRNLVDNAVKFTEQGEVTVAACPGRTAGWVTIEVSDTGPGIRPEDVESIFDPFHQLGSASTRETGGVGLGLSIVKQLVEVLGGRVSVGSRTGGGAVFHVELPCTLPGVSAGDVLPTAVEALDGVGHNTAKVPDRLHARRRTASP
jgi:signal transduction histidine kinase